MRKNWKSEAKIPGAAATKKEKCRPPAIEKEAGTGWEKRFR